MRVFKLTENEPQPGCRAIEVEGELDLAVAAEMEAALGRAVAECERLLIGLENCEFIDSTGIAAIVRAHNQMLERGGRCAVYGATGAVHRTLAITGLTENGLVFETAEQALAGPSDVG